MTDFDINELIRHCVISLQQLLIENLEFKADFETEIICPCGHGFYQGPYKSSS